MSKTQFLTCSACVVATLLEVTPTQATPITSDELKIIDFQNPPNQLLDFRQEQLDPEDIELDLVRLRFPDNAAFVAKFIPYREPLSPEDKYSDFLVMDVTHTVDPKGRPVALLDFLLVSDGSVPLTTEDFTSAPPSSRKI